MKRDYSVFDKTKNKKDHRILTEETGVWLVRLFMLVVLTILFGYAGLYLDASHGLGWTIGVFAGIVVWELWSIKHSLTKRRKDRK